MSAVRVPAWWSSLELSGLFLDPERLGDAFQTPLEPLEGWLEDRLRLELDRFHSSGELAPLLDTVLESVSELGRTGLSGGGRWLKAAAVPEEFRRPTLTERAFRPRRLWLGLFGAQLPVFTDDEPRLGVGKGKRAQARVLEWLRAKPNGLPLALLTNGRQWRLIYAGPGHDAHLEWDTERWFEEGRPSAQVDALRALLRPRALTPPAEGAPPSLMRAIQETRKGQTRLTSELGERVRRAVEILVRETLQDRAIPTEDRKDVYAAAVRAVMRLVVILFAESRDLLPRDNAIYHESYGLQSLRAALERQRGDRERLGRGRTSWPRLLALFRLVHEGSGHERMPIPRYGGHLFAANLPHDELFRDPSHGPDDGRVAEILRLLTRGANERPVDFSGLSTEYIGILYEGLLDYELHQAPADQPVVFLDLGDQPALPLGRLEAMDDKALAALVEKAKKKKALSIGDDEAEDEDEDSDAEESEADESASEKEDELNESAAASAPAAAATEEDDAHETARRRAAAWACRAVRAGGLVPRPRSQKPDALRQFEEAVAMRAESLLARTFLPGEWYLVRFGGTRKGAGAFYTKPELARPTVERTLRPLTYEDDGRLRFPEQILALKVCDPACGSGSFLVAALRFLSEALLQSLHHHERIQPRTGGALLRLAEGRPGGEDLPAQTVKYPPDHPDFEDTVRAQLRRFVVERCLYGVDYDPIAVDLCRVSLWVETMDRDLPFSFLDHKVKVGNSLVGCWFDRFRDYPALAWEREGGDANHGNGVHYRKEEWTKAIKAARNGWVKESLADWIRGQRPLVGRAAGETPEAVHDRGLARMAEMHHVDLHEPEKQADLYVLWERDEARVRLKEAFDTWCALWFWPPDRLDFAPRPEDFENPSADTRAVVLELARHHRFFHWELEFPDVFHTGRAGFDAMVGNPPWENLQANPAEFFSAADPLFRAYGRLESLAAMRDQFGSIPGRERQWLEYSSSFKAFANFARNTYAPFGDPEDEAKSFPLGRRSTVLHQAWRSARTARTGYADPEHPFRHQWKGRIFTYKLFLEASHALLRAGGRIGFLVPSGIYTDKGSLALRSLFLDRCRWEWIFSFENRNKVFDIHSSFKFCTIILEKGGRTEALKTAFMHRDPADWAEAERYATLYDRNRIERFSPKTRTLLEIRGPRDLDLLEKVYSHAVLLGNESEEGWNLRYSLEFMMNTHAYLFPPRRAWEEKGYRPDEYSRWLLGPWQTRTPGSAAPLDVPRHALAPGILLSRDGTHFLHESEIARDPESGHPGIALPLYQGVMFWQLDPCYQGHESGRGRNAKWRRMEGLERFVQPLYLMADHDRWQSSKYSPRPKVAYRRIAPATNERTVVSTALVGPPAGDSVFFYVPASGSLSVALLVGGLFSSLSFDWQVRIRLGGTNLNDFIMTDASLPSRAHLGAIASAILRILVSLNMPGLHWAPQWLEQPLTDRTQSWRRRWALSSHERLRLQCMLDAVVFALYGLEDQDVRHMLLDVDHPIEDLGRKPFARSLDSKGFWRVDKDKDPELRHTVLALAAFADLQAHIASAGGDREQGVRAFLVQNEGEGWMLPETLRLADLGLGHDERARQSQPVAERLGPRFLPFQLAEDPESSWQECALHARNLLGAEGYKRLVEGEAVEVAEHASPYQGHSLAAEGPATSGEQRREPYQNRLFPGEPSLFDERGPADRG